MGAQFSFTRQEGNSFAPMPAGIYELQIDDVEEGTSKSGNPQLTLKCHVCDGDAEGKKVTMWLSLVPQSLWKVQLLTDAVGLTSPEDTEISFDSDDLIGCRFQATNEPREYQGKMRDDWQSFEPSALDAQEQDAQAGTKEPEKPAAPVVQQSARRQRRLGA